MTPSTNRRDPVDAGGAESREVLIPPVGLAGMLRIPPYAKALVVFAHGSGSSRFTLLFDLLTAEEEVDRRNVFDIRLLAQRLVDAVRWIDGDPAQARQKIGLFGASTGAAAALVAAAHLGERVGAVVSRGGRPDLGGDALDADHEVIKLNQLAFDRLKGTKSLVIVPHATHLFAEKGALDAAIDHATRWFVRHFDTPKG